MKHGVQNNSPHFRLCCHVCVCARAYSFSQGVESEKCPSFTRALENKSPVFVANQETLADGLAVPQVGYNAYATTVPLLDKMIVVKEEWIALAILRLVELEKCVVEGAGAAGLAAILAGHLDEFIGKR